MGIRTLGDFVDEEAIIEVSGRAEQAYNQLQVSNFPNIIKDSYNPDRKLISLLGSKRSSIRSIRYPNQKNKRARICYLET